MKATLTRSGATGYSTANWKSYDVWGGERASTGSGSMFGYGGNLGHPTDPENGLIYMRARFYEPWTGRFLSADPARHGWNWYGYADNSPACANDPSGLSPASSFLQQFRQSEFFKFSQRPEFQFSVTMIQLSMMMRNSLQSYAASLVALSALIFLGEWFAVSAGTDEQMDAGPFSLALFSMYGLITEFGGTAEGASDVKAKAKAVIQNYSLMLSMFIRLELWKEGW